MTSPDDLRFIFTSKAAEVLPPITQDLVDALDLGHDDLDAVGQALARAFMQGAAVGAAEKGIQLQLNWVDGPTEP
jgi:hypothetical protein